MPDEFLMTVRAAAGGQFTADVGPTRFLRVPVGVVPALAHEQSSASWLADVQAAGAWSTPGPAPQPRGDIVFVVHGYNMSEAEVIDRHRRIRLGLEECGFLGVVVSYDWPCGNNALAYLEDRHRAKQTALRLVSDGIAHLSEKQAPNCPINVHVLGHSTGAYVIREAFDDADDTRLRNSAWSVSQVIFAAGDVSSDSMSEGNPGAESVYKHCVRVTNYSNRHDSVLDLSNVKRLGVASRVGRIGLPNDAPTKAINVECSTYYETLDSSPIVQAADQPMGTVGAPSHSWYFGNRVFNRDLFSTIIGVDRHSMTTREVGADGKVTLKRP